MKIALVHDYFNQMGGAERVVEALYRILPDATLFATVSNPAKLPEGLRTAKIQTSWMQHLPGKDRFYRQLFPLYPLGVAGLNLKGYDLVISSSSGYAKGVKVDPNALHICYCHTPMRWVWRYNDYASRENFGLAKRLLLPVLVNNLKRWDENAARQPDQFVVNSSVVAERVWTAYKRKAIIIPPPINVDRFKISLIQEDFYLVLSRLVSYKRIELAVEACTRMKRRLIVIGDGPDRGRLEGMAGPTIEFLGRISDKQVETYASTCRALIFAGEEDFGMVPLEINAAGRPVIAFKGGGALDTVISGVTGIFFEDDTADSLCSAIQDFEFRTWDQAAIRRHAQAFDTGTFELRFTQLLSALTRNDTASQDVARAVGMSA